MKRPVGLFEAHHLRDCLQTPLCRRQCLALAARHSNAHVSEFSAGGPLRPQPQLIIIVVFAVVLIRPTALVNINKANIILGEWLRLWRAVSL